MNTETLKQVVLDLRAADPDNTAANTIQAFIDANVSAVSVDSVTVTVNGVAKVAPFSAFV